MLELTQLGRSDAQAAVMAQEVDNHPPSGLNQRIRNAFHSAGSLCNRECLVSCKEKAIQVYKTCTPLFQFGITCSLLAFGAYNSFLVGVPGIVQGFLNNNQGLLDNETQKIALLAFGTGIVQLIAWNRRMNRYTEANRDVNDTLIESTAGGIAAVGSFFPATHIAQIVQDQISTQKIAKIAVGVLAQTASGAVIAGVATIATVLLVKSAIHLYGRAREYYFRRQNPDLLAPLAE